MQIQATPGPGQVLDYFPHSYSWIAFCLSLACMLCRWFLVMDDAGSGVGWLALQKAISWHRNCCWTVPRASSL